MDDFEPGEKTFYEQARWNIDWFESWMVETHLAIQRNVPGEWEHLTAEVDALCTKSAPSGQKPVEKQ